MTCALLQLTKFSNKLSAERYVLLFEVDMVWAISLAACIAKAFIQYADVVSSYSVS